MANQPIQPTAEEELLIQKWIDLVHKKADTVDPDNVYDWASLAYGFFLALEISIPDTEFLISALIARDLL